MIQITPKEQYQLITIGWTSINPDSFQKNQQLIIDALAVESSFIIDISNLETLNGAIQMFFNDLKNEIKKADGHLVLSQGNKNVTEHLENLEYTCIPSLDEAVDYIFMEQIEKSLGDEVD